MKVTLPALIAPLDVSAPLLVADKLPVRLNPAKVTPPLPELLMVALPAVTEAPVLKVIALVMPKLFIVKLVPANNVLLAPMLVLPVLVVLSVPENPFNVRATADPAVPPTKGPRLI